MKRNGKRDNYRGGGFTLLEVTLSIIIVGIAVVALMMLFTSGTKVNAYGNDLSTGVFLAEQLRAMTDEVAFDDLLSYHNIPYNGVDAEGNPVTGLQNFQQRLIVQGVNPDNFTLYIGPDPEAFLVTAAVTHEGAELTCIRWLRFK